MRYYIDFAFNDLPIDLNEHIKKFKYIVPDYIYLGDYSGPKFFEGLCHITFDSRYPSLPCQYIIRILDVDNKELYYNYLFSLDMSVIGAVLAIDECMMKLRLIGSFIYNKDSLDYMEVYTAFYDIEYSHNTNRMLYYVTYDLLELNTVELTETETEVTL